MKLYESNNYSKLSNVCMVGVFPPPVHGQSLCNEAIRKNLLELGNQPLVIDLSPKSLDRSLSDRLLRAKKVMEPVRSAEGLRIKNRVLKN